MPRHEILHLRAVLFHKHRTGHVSNTASRLHKLGGAFDTAPGKSLPVNTPTPITMTIRNTGTEPLVNVHVSDLTTSGPALTNLTCNFAALGGPKNYVAPE